jgi:hypothetical protein
MLIALSIITGLLLIWLILSDDRELALICLMVIGFFGWFIIGITMPIKSKTQINLIDSKDLSIIVDNKTYAVFITDLSDNDKTYIQKDAKTYNLIKDYNNLDVCFYKKIKYNMYNFPIKKELIISETEIK